jgi:hypothetical protein
MIAVIKPSTERKIIRWIHILFSIPVLGYLYGPVAEIPEAAFVTRWVFLPVIVFSGIWLWKGQWLKKQLKLVEKDSQEVIKTNL